MRALKATTPLTLASIIAACCIVIVAEARTPKPKEVASDPALQQPAIQISPGNAYADDTRIFQGVPSIECAANGRLWAAWFAGGEDEGPDNYVMLVTSDDNGASWSKPVLVIDPPGTVRAFDPCLWHDPDGRLWLFWSQSNGKWDGRGGVWCITSENSADASPAWSKPRHLCNGVMLSKPTVRKNGDWLLPVSVWAKPAFPEPQFHLDDESGANVFISRDSGASFSMLGQVRVPEREYDEHSIIERNDRSLWMLVRAPYGIGESESTDGGESWTKGRPSEIQNVNSRFCIRRLHSGSLLLITHEPPNGKSRSHLIAHISDDDGKSWRGELMLDERKGVSYPDAVEDSHGVIRVVYDFERTKSKQILMAEFTKGDVLNGELERDARLRVLVNQATGIKAKK
jgi:predicted neuraminidase